MAPDNMTLGRFRLDGIPPAPRGVPKVEVDFDIDVNGIVSVKAKDLGTGKEQKITITASTNLSEEEIEGLVKEAELHGAEDEVRRESIELRNRADGMAYQAERMIKDNGDKVSDSDKETLEEAIKNVRELLEAEDTESETLRAAVAELEKLSMDVGQQIHQAQAGPSPEEGVDGQGDAVVDEASVSDDSVEDGDVVDAEFSASDEK